MAEDSPPTLPPQLELDTDIMRADRQPLRAFGVGAGAAVQLDGSLPVFAVTKLKGALMEAASKVESLTRERTAAQAEAEAAKAVGVGGLDGGLPMRFRLLTTFALRPHPAGPRLPEILRSVQQLLELHRGQQLHRMRMWWQLYRTR
jgi:hypothetical protein